MTNFTDRILLVVIASTALGSLFMWLSGFVEAEVSGTNELLFRGMLIVLFVATMVLIWRSAQTTEE